ncbi:helix-turn-helix domain-containing protein [Nocardioides terrigena]|uniref:helix-turn-helix domain-containing protein n=1 Tax=Nocardioides terrigena TaxID=424797 RepID=UPI00131F1DE2|nr:helix-turn-helix domain-containing protein [Nocardioides terrigena]
MEEPPWFELLRTARTEAGLSRRATAERVALSVETIRSYEDGRRRPSRSSLHALLDGLDVDPMRRAQIIEAVGFAVPSSFVGRQAQAPDYTVHEAAADIATYPWPAHVNTEVFEVVAVNQPMEALWGVDLAAIPSAVERNMLIALTEPRWADHIVNWDEAMRLVAAMLRGGYGDDLTAHPYVGAVVERLLTGATPYVQRFVSIWATTEPAVQKWRFSFPITWRLDSGDELRFRVSVNPASMERYITISEWIPVDAATWTLLEGLDTG